MIWVTLPLQSSPTWTHPSYAVFGYCPFRPAPTSPAPPAHCRGTAGADQKQPQIRNQTQTGEKKLRFSLSGRAKGTFPYIFHVRLYFGKLPLVSSHFAGRRLLPPQPGCWNFFFRTLRIQSLSRQLRRLSLTRKLKYFPSSSYQETMCQTRWN